MPQIITLAHQKGGVGKSTLTLNLAMEFKDHLKTVVIDLDPQGTLSGLKKLIKGIDILVLDINKLEQIKSLPYEIVFIDTPPYLSSYLPNLFKLSDLILIPTKAGLADIMAIRSTIKVIEEAHEKNNALVVLNMIKYNTTLTEDIKLMLKDYSINIANTQIVDRVSYTRSLISNSTKEDKKANKEINDLSRELLIKLKEIKQRK
jgi:chromosome partitioning protein